jgi:hypothetical protein
MQIDPDLIVNKDKLNSVGEILNCVICSNILFQPMTCINCENSFCKECIIKWENKNKNCPLCKKELKTKESRIIKNLLSDLIIKCEKCNKDIKYDDFKNHQILCEKSNIDYKTEYLKLKKNYDELNEKFLKLKNFINNEVNIKESIKNFSVKHKSHIHPLMKVFTERNGWGCDKCKKVFKKNVASYYCTVCDFDLCSECIKNN